MLINLFVAMLLVVIALGLWGLLHTRDKLRQQSGAGRASITGACGDNILLNLHFREGRLVDGVQRTSGCAFSFSALQTAIQLAKGKTAEEVLRITPEVILQVVADLPHDHRHAADMAARALHEATKDYLHHMAA
jgi:NifU-like protein involved in Fe-S cluster formation